MKFALLVLALGFIDTAIRSRGDKTKDGIFGVDATMSLVTFGTVDTHHIMRYYLSPVVNHERCWHERLPVAIRLCVWCTGSPGSPYIEPDRLVPNTGSPSLQILVTTHQSTLDTRAAAVNKKPDLRNCMQQQVLALGSVLVRMCNIKTQRF